MAFVTHSRAPGRAETARVTSRARASRRTHCGSRARALAPNKDWPPADVWGDFARAHERDYAGARVTFDARGCPIAARDDGVDGAQRDGGHNLNSIVDACDAVRVDVRTRGARMSDDDGVRLETSSAVDGRVLDAREICTGGQMGKMFIVQGFYADGPQILPQCEQGREVKFSFGFVDEDEEPGKRLRVDLTVRAAPGKKRNWELASVDMTLESCPGVEMTARFDGILAEDDLTSGSWRATSGATFIALEALADVPEDRDVGGNASTSSSSSSMSASDSDDTAQTKTLGPAQTMAAKKPDDSALARAAEAEKRVEEARAKDELEARTRPPEGLLVVPWWAVKSPASWAQGGEYILGGNSPLVFLPFYTWVLVESIDDQLVLECGRYTDGPPIDDAENDDTSRRVIARRYRKGRFASAFFVEERRLDRAERDAENEDFDVLEGLEDI